MTIETEVLVWLGIAAYLLIGLFLGLVDHAIVSLEVGRLPGLLTTCLVASGILWPFFLPDLFFRLLTGRWAGEDPYSQPKAQLPADVHLRAAVEGYHREMRRNFHPNTRFTK